MQGHFRATLFFQLHGNPGFTSTGSSFRSPLPFTLNEVIFTGFYMACIYHTLHNPARLPFYTPYRPTRKPFKKGCKQSVPSTMVLEYSMLLYYTSQGVIETAIYCLWEPLWKCGEVDDLATVHLPVDKRDDDPHQARPMKNGVCDGRYNLRLAGFVHTIARNDIVRMTISLRVYCPEFTLFHRLTANDWVESAK